MGGIGMSCEHKGKGESQNRIYFNKVQADLLVPPTEAEKQNAIKQN